MKRNLVCAVGRQQQMDNCDTSPPICAFSETENGDDFVVIVDDDGDEEEEEEVTDVHEIMDEEESGQGKH